MKLPSLKVICWTNKDTAPQSHEILQTFVRCCDPPPLTPTIQTSVNFRSFAEPYLRSLQTYHFQNGSFTNIKVPLSVASTVFPQLIHDESWRSIVLLWIVSVYPETIRTYIPKRGGGRGGHWPQISAVWGGYGTPAPAACSAAYAQVELNLAFLFSQERITRSEQLF